MDGPEITVLHIDDDPAILDLAATAIEREYNNITVETETDPRNCLPRLDNGHAIDCIVCDYEMPHFSGLQLLESVRDSHPDFPFILFTGKGSEEIAAEAITKGIDDYMQKQAGIDQFRLLANRINHNVHRVRAQRALSDSEAKYRALVEQSLVGIYLIQNDIYTYINPRMAEIFGYDREELLGQQPSMIVAEKDLKRADQYLRQRLRGDIDSVRYALTGIHKNGHEIQIIAQGRRIDLKGGPAVAGVLLAPDDFENDTP